MSKNIPITEADLSAIAHHLFGYDCVVDAKAGIFIARIPTREEGYRLLVHPSARIIHQKDFGKGCTEIVVKRG